MLRYQGRTALSTCSCSDTFTRIIARPTRYVSRNIHHDFVLKFVELLSLYPHDLYQTVSNLKVDLNHEITLEGICTLVFINFGLEAPPFHTYSCLCVVEGETPWQKFQQIRAVRYCWIHKRGAHLRYQPWSVPVICLKGWYRRVVRLAMLLLWMVLPCYYVNEIACRNWSLLPAPMCQLSGTSLGIVPWNPHKCQRRRWDCVPWKSYKS